MTVGGIGDCTKRRGDDDEEKKQDDALAKMEVTRRGSCDSGGGKRSQRGPEEVRLGSEAVLPVHVARALDTLQVLLLE